MAEAQMTHAYHRCIHAGVSGLRDCGSGGMLLTGWLCTGVPALEHRALVSIGLVSISIRPLYEDRHSMVAVPSARTQCRNSGSGTGFRVWRRAVPPPQPAPCQSRA
jgi:hypothetical protein